MNCRFKLLVMDTRGEYLVDAGVYVVTDVVYGAQHLAPYGMVLTQRLQRRGGEFRTPHFCFWP